MRLLELDHITATYGKVAALHGLSFHIDEGEIVALLGANGAGKSTTLRVISGLLKPRTGTVRLLGQTISGHSPESIFRLGVAHVPERRRVFPGLTVRENISSAARIARAQRAPNFSPMPSVCSTSFRSCAISRSARLDALRRTAADGRDRARPDVASQDPVAG